MANPPRPQVSKKDLYGGAINVNLPTEYLDARYVPLTHLNPVHILLAVIIHLRRYKDVDEMMALISRSDLRQIPDNQEVFLSPKSETSVVIEILAMVEDGLASTDLYEAIR